eukprot:4563371-Pyramimonas_sp.AAC.1
MRMMRRMMSMMRMRRMSRMMRGFRMRSPQAARCALSRHSSPGRSDLPGAAPALARLQRRGAPLPAVPQ